MVSTVPSVTLRHHPFLMSHFHSISERQYRCLGQWTDGGLTYTYTQRQDIGTYECFVGAIVSDTEIFIKEAGEHCERELNPSEYGMRLTRKGKL